MVSALLAVLTRPLADQAKVYDPEAVNPETLTCCSTQVVAVTVWAPVDEAETAGKVIPDTLLVVTGVVVADDDKVPDP